MFNQVLEHINWLHVLVAAVAYFALGAAWYSPVLFAKSWVKLTGINMDDKKGMGAMMGGSFIFMLVTTVGLAVLQQILPAIDAVGGLKLGLFVAVTISLTSISIAYIYTKKPLALYAIDGGYQILGIVIASTILAAWH